MTTMLRAAPCALTTALLMITLTAPRDARADEFTGMAPDAKDMTPATMRVQSVYVDPNAATPFQPLPAWARGAIMPPLPQALKPMGGKVAVLTTPPVPAPAVPLAPPKDATVEKLKPVAPAPPAPAPSPALIAVSPFLQWIKANPQAAADQARQQAGAYQAGSDAATAPAAPVAPNAGTPTGPIEAPYWMPPLIDNSSFGTLPSGSGAAIYTRPQQ